MIFFTYTLSCTNKQVLSEFFQFHYHLVLFNLLHVEGVSSGIMDMEETNSVVRPEDDGAQDSGEEDETEVERVNDQFKLLHELQQQTKITSIEFWSRCDFRLYTT